MRVRYVAAAVFCCALLLFPVRSAYPVDAVPDFVLAAVVATGSTVYNHEDLYALYQDSLGKRVDEAQLHAIAGAVTQMYRRDGYILARAEIPPQTVQFGVVYLRIDEGAITHVEVNPPELGRSHMIRAHLDKIRHKRPLERRRLERYLGLIDDLPGVGGTFRIKSIDPDRRDYTLALDIRQQRKLAVNADIDNHGSERIGPIRTWLGLRLHPPSDNHEAFDLGFAAAGESLREMQYLGLGVQRPLGSEGERLVLTSYLRHSEPGGDAKDQQLEFDTTSIELMVERNLVRTFKHTVTASAGARHYDSRFDRGGDRVRRDKIRRLAAVVSWRRNGPRAYTNMRSRVHHGIKSASESPSNARLDFVKVRVDLTQTLVITPKTEFVVRLKGQYAAHRLPSSERMAYGGSYFGRAFDPGELGGDRGVGGAVEARSRLFAIPRHKAYLWGHLFYDGARLWRIRQDRTTALSATSAGIGARVDMGRLSASLELAKPLTRQTREDGRDWRVFAGIALSY